MASVDTTTEKFRETLSRFPTGVVVVTCMGDGGQPAGMTVGSFTSVSLDPALVAFFPAKSSSSFPAVREAGRFCVNVLAADQVDVCRSFATKGADRFAGLPWRAAGSGSPVLDGSLAWIDCDIEDIIEAGDHYIVLGRVHDLGVARDESPLVFYRGGYGQFHAPTLTAPADAALMAPLRVVDVCRSDMERLNRDLGYECLALTLIRDELVVIGSAGGRPPRAGFDTRIGQRVPLIPPLGAAFLAWSSEARIESWIESADDRANHDDYRQMLARVRERGWSLALRSSAQMALEAVVGDYDPSGPSSEQTRRLREAASRLGSTTYELVRIDDEDTYDVRTITAPVFDEAGNVCVTLALYGLPSGTSGRLLRRATDELVSTCERLSGSLPP